MSEHHAQIAWTRTGADFSYEKYNRAHEWRLGSISVQASSAKEFRGDPNLVNPEEALVASLSSCHMLTFLAVASRKRLPLDSYTDDAVGFLEKNEAGRLAITRVILRPKIAWAAGVTVSKEDLDRMHHQSHEECFIANSVKTSVTVEPEA